MKQKSQEITKERFLQIMLERAYSFLENPQGFGLKYVSEITEIPVREFKPKRLEQGDKLLIRRSCVEYLDRFIKERRKLYAHNAGISWIRIALFDREYSEFNEEI